MPLPQLFLLSMIGSLAFSLPVALLCAALAFKTLPFFYFSVLHSLAGDERSPTRCMERLGLTEQDAGDDLHQRRAIVIALMIVPYLAKAMAVGVYATLSLLSHTNAWTWPDAEAPANFRAYMDVAIALLVASHVFDFGPMVYGHYLASKKRALLKHELDATKKKKRLASRSSGLNTYI